MAVTSVRRVSPKEALELIQQGYEYVDVRSIPEYDAGHPAGAYNVPLLHFVPGAGLRPNPEFTDVFTLHFGKDDKIVVGCKAGVRSLRAAEQLSALGYENVVDMRGGFECETDGFGRVAEPGWRQCGLPTEQRTPGRSYGDLKK